MWRLLGFGCVAASLVLFASSDASAQKKDKKTDAKKNGEMASAQDYIGIQSVKEMVGKILSVDAGSKSLTLQVDFPHMEPNPSYKPNTGGGGNNNYQMLNNLYRDQQQLANAKTPQQRAQLQNRIMMDYQKIQMQQMQQMAKAAKDAANPTAQNGPYKIVHSFKNFELDVKDKVVVRKLILGTEYDDMGNLKTYTKAQLAEMRGSDTTKPGYAAKYEDLVAGQEVKVFLTAPKNLAKKGAKNDDEGIGNIEKPTINTILMTSEPPSSLSTGAPKKGKK